MHSIKGLLSCPEIRPMTALTAWRIPHRALGYVRCIARVPCSLAVAEARRRHVHFTAAATATPQPTPDRAVVDLDGPRSARWLQTRQWVVFADLHVTNKTLETCCEVLQRVREEAASRGAGIIFLGDMWDKRGDLPVHVLNRLLVEFKLWEKVPTIMLVGNHDQVDIGGREHAMFPLAAACPWMHVIDVPTKLLNALWLPYRKSHDELQAAIRASGNCKAVFAHADVAGARMNTAFQAKDGLSPTFFPADVPIFSGHYHIPHVVDNSNIRYIGSPYQVSRSEAGQAKALLVLDQDFALVEQISLDIGPRHFAAASGAPPPQDLRPGDRLKWTLRDGAEELAVKASVDALRQEGVEVEVTLQRPDAVQRIQQADAMGPMQLLEAFAEHCDLDADALTCAKGIVEGLGTQPTPPMVNLDLHEVQLAGYGPFRDQAVYQLKDRGLRVVTGRNEDEPLFESNGAGKSALVTAALWCLTGRATPAGEAAGTKQDVIHDGAKLARVTVRGVVNGQDFEVERTAKRSKTGASSSLTFQLGGETQSTLQMNMTQARMDQHLGADLLPRTVFHSRGEPGSLLEAGDKEFKKDMGLLVEVGLWERAALEAADLLTASKAQQMQLTGGQNVQLNQLAKLQAQINGKQQEAADWEGKQAAQLQQAQAAVQQASAAVEASCDSIAINMQPLSAWLQQQSQPSQPLSTRLAVPEDPSFAAELAAAKQRVQEAQQNQAEVQTQASQAQAALSPATSQRSEINGSLKVKKQDMKEYASLSSSHGHAAGFVCDRCLQEIDQAAYGSNLSGMQQEIAALEARLATAKHAESRAENKYSAAYKAYQDAQRQANLAQEAFRALMQKQEWEADRFRTAQLGERDKASQIRKAQQRVLAFLQNRGSSGAGAAQQPAVADSTDAQQRAYLLEQQLNAAQQQEGTLERAQWGLDHARLSDNHAARDLSSLQSQLDSLQEAVQADGAKLGALAGDILAQTAARDAFGRQGIQSFVVEGVLAELQAACAHYLEQLASGYTLTLTPTKESASKRSPAAPTEKVDKLVTIRSRSENGDTVTRDRSIPALSSGERRRVALALALGFGDVLAQRGRLVCNLLVLDEVMQHLDQEGCARVAGLLRNVHHSTVLLVAQAGTATSQEFDSMDVVVKSNGSAHIEAMS